MLENSLSRRNFLKASGMVAAGGGASMMLAGCNPSSTDTPQASDKKKILRYGSANSKQGLDMQRANNSQSACVADSVCESLLRWTEDNELVTCLLKEIPTFESDGVTLKCELKEGVKFHDGTTLTAKDVKYTFERMFKPETKALSTSFFDKIKGAPEMLAGKATELEGLTVQDDTHFTFTLSEPYVVFVSVLGISYACIFPEKACEAAGVLVLILLVLVSTRLRATMILPRLFLSVLMTTMTASLHWMRFVFTTMTIPILSCLHLRTMTLITAIFHLLCISSIQAMLT